MAIHIEHKNLTLNKILIYMFVLSLPISIGLRQEYDLYAFIPFIITIFLLNALNIKLVFGLIKDALNINKNGSLIFFILPILIALFYFCILGFRDISLIHFILIFSTSYLISQLSLKNILSDIANPWICLGMINSFGIILGLIEVNFMESNLFHAVLYDVPYSDGPRTSISGFLYNYNQAAYFQVTALAFLPFQSIFSKTTSYFIGMVLLLTLLLTSSKFSLLYVMALILFWFFKNNHRLIFFFLVAGVSCAYIFLTNIIIANNGSYELGSPHFQKVLFSIYNFDFLLGAYGSFKLSFWEAIYGAGLTPIGLDVFLNKNGFYPHNMIAGNILSGGYFFAIAIILCLIRTLKGIMYYREKSILDFLTLPGVFVFLLETINWDFSHSAYFWSLIFFIPLILNKENWIKENL
jgi:hypothetical protein